VASDWSRYWRSPDTPLEAMHAHFERHVYHRHSHETYSFGVTETGVQSFNCRGSAWASTAGMIMAFNPDDPHDGKPGDQLGFTYRMIHVGPELVAGILGDITGRPAGLPLFADPVVSDPALAGRLRALHRALLGEATALRRDELLTTAVCSVVRWAAGRTRVAAPGPLPAGARTDARRVRQVISDTYLDDITGAELASCTGRSRFATYRAFTSAYGMAPGAYQRQLRLRGARRLIARGEPIALAAAQAGFSDQSHLTRWFVRCYGITPGAFQRATHPGRRVG
jgi:AraC-like DNA-binding protein